MYENVRKGGIRLNEVIELLKSHRSIRRFTNQDVEEKMLMEIIHAARHSATSSFLQAYSVIRVRDKEKKEKLSVYCGDQKHIRQAPVFLVFCADLHKLSTACDIQNKEMSKGYSEQLILASVDTAIWGQSVLLAAESMGLGGVYVGGIRNNPDKVTELLQLPQQVYPVFGMSLGYPDQDPQVKPRMPLPLVYKEEVYQSENDKDLLASYDKTFQEYLRNRQHNPREETWTATVAEKLSKESRPHMKQYLQSQGFNIK